MAPYIAYVKKIFIGFLIQLLLLGQLDAQVLPDKAVSDSLCNALQNCQTDKNKISILKKLVNLYWQLPEEVTYLNHIINIAGQEDSVNVVYVAMAGLCRHYFNENKEDSLLYWRNQLDSVSFAHGDHPDALYRVGRLICKMHLEEANYELAMNEAIRQKNKAESVSQEFGLMCANQNLGLIYQKVRRDDEAVIVFRDGLKWWDKNLEKPTLAMQFLSEMIVSTLRINSFEETKTLLEKYLKIFEAEEQKFKSIGLKFPMLWHRWLIEAFYAELYVRNNQSEKAREHLNKATRYIADEIDESIKYPYYQAQSLFYIETKNYPLALKAINDALALDSNLVMLKMKVDVLRAAGDSREALSMYDELLKRNSKVGNEAFTRQMKQLGVLNDLNDKNKQESELKYQAEQFAIKQRLLIISIFFSIILLFVFYYLCRYFRHTSRLKDELLNEKNLLVESEKQLQEAKGKAEKANQEKTAFIANISHEVRTPLNAIVGFSELLAEGVCDDDEKKEFAVTINNNSEILMNLVNDVLDLSRLESGNTRFELRAYDLVSCCEEVVDEVKHRIAPGVELLFNTPFESYIIRTDPIRVRQLLTKLLLNAMKFTSEGEITLSYEVDEVKSEIRFAVSDTGCGIPMEKQGDIFERFEKLDDFVQGTGLGLPICKNIATKFGGDLFVDPTYVKGARFIFIHPLLKNL